MGGVTDSPTFATSTTDDGLPLLTIEGELDAGASSEVAAALEAMVTDGVEVVVVDVAGVPFMDSRGFGAILAAHRAGARIVIRHPKPQVKRLLDLVAVPGVVSVED